MQKSVKYTYFIHNIHSGSRTKDGNEFTVLEVDCEGGMDEIRTTGIIIFFIPPFSKKTF